MGMTFNDDDFGKKMEGITKDTQSDGMSDSVRETLECVFSESQDLVPRKTGKLAASGEVTDSIMTGLKAEAGIIYTEDYAEIVEFNLKSFLRVPMARSKVKMKLTRITGNNLTNIFKNNS